MSPADLIIVVLAIFGANGVGWMAVKTEIKYMRRDIHSLQKKVFGEHVGQLGD